MDAEAQADAASQAGAMRWNRELEDMPVKVGAHWENLEIPARQLAGLKVGEILTLPEGSAEQVLVSLGGKTKFGGTLGTQNRRWAVCLKELLEKKQR